jgi:cytochrome c553
MIRKRPGYFPIWLVLPVVIVSLVAAARYPNFLRASMMAGADRAAAVRFVGSNTCGKCHAAELQSWNGSHHPLAMQSASDSAVLAILRK